jgi:hypothetical protein
MPHVRLRVQSNPQTYGLPGLVGASCGESLYGAPELSGVWSKKSQHEVQAIVTVAPQSSVCRCETLSKALRDINSPTSTAAGFRNIYSNARPHRPTDRPDTHRPHRTRPPLGPLAFRDSQAVRITVLHSLFVGCFLRQDPEPPLPGSWSSLMPHSPVLPALAVRCLLIIKQHVESMVRRVGLNVQCTIGKR